MAKIKIGVVVHKNQCFFIEDGKTKLPLHPIDVKILIERTPITIMAIISGVKNRIEYKVVRLHKNKYAKILWEYANQVVD